MFLSKRATKGGTYEVPNIQFLDEGNGNAPILPDSITWTLKNDFGDTMATGTIDPPALSNSVVLQGEQLAILDKELVNYRTVNGIKVYYGIRRLCVKALVDSSFGDDSPAPGEFLFFIDNVSCS